MYPQLLEKVRIGKHVLKNRMVYAPTISNLADSNGGVSRRMLAYYDNLSKEEHRWSTSERSIWGPSR